MQERRTHIDCDSYFNTQFGAKPVYIKPGEHGSGDSMEEMIVATIGSGVAVSIYDKDLHVGGLAYVLMPENMVKAFPHFDACSEKIVQEVTKPIDDLLGALKRLGAGKNRIRIRLIGGTSLPGDEMDQGTKNYIFVKEYLARKGLSIMSEDMAGPYVRRVHFFPTSGRSVRRTLRRKEDYVGMHEDELRYQQYYQQVVQ